MKLALSTLFVVGTAAFTPAKQQSTTSSTALADSPYKNALGAQAPLGFYDPFNLLQDVPQEGFDNIRYIELKHGRVAMLAVAGYLTTAAGIRFPGAGEVPDGVAAFKYIASQEWGSNLLVQMTATVALMEIVNRDATGKAEFMGDFRNGALDFGWDSLSDATKMKKRAIELNNGRAAMMGILGLVTHEAMGSAVLPGGYLPGQM